MVGLCLVAIFAMSATVLVVASPASASCDEACKIEKKEAKEIAKEKAALAKWEEKRIGDPFGPNSYGAFKACKYAIAEEFETCFLGITAGGKEGGFFEFGKVKVPLSKSIALQGTFNGAGTEVKVFPAAHGYETLDAPPLPVNGGLKLLTPNIQQTDAWPAALSESWAAAIKNKETAVDVKIEMAGNECFETLGCLNAENIIFEEGTAFNLPLKVKVTSPWLETLGSGPCYIGSDEHPIHIHLTTAGGGFPGKIEFNEEFTHVTLAGSKLVDLGWHIEAASSPKGCGGTYESYVDSSLARVLEVQNPNRTGIVVLKGDLHTGGILGFGDNQTLQEEGERRGELP